MRYGGSWAKYPFNQWSTDAVVMERNKSWQPQRSRLNNGRWVLHNVLRGTRPLLCYEQRKRRELVQEVLGMGVFM